MDERDKKMFDHEIKTIHRDVRGNITTEIVSRTDESTWPELEQEFIRHLRGAGFIIPEGYEEWEKYDPDSDEAKAEREEDEKKEEFLWKNGYYDKEGPIEKVPTLPDGAQDWSFLDDGDKRPEGSEEEDESCEDPEPEELDSLYEQLKGLVARYKRPWKVYRHDTGVSSGPGIGWTNDPQDSEG